MIYKQTIDYLFRQLPMFQKIGEKAYNPSLDKSFALSKYFNAPEKKFKSIHIAGTNGKGSTSHMIASILQEAGYKVGLYTSPHLKDFRERIKINGRQIHKNSVIAFVKKNKKYFDELKPSFFEMTVALAFHHFAKNKVDFAVVETGLGGRLDSTNIITPILSVITNISYDHVSILGNTLEKIAKEKAGIIKQNVPVVISEKQNETEDVFIKIAQQKNAPICFADTELLLTSYHQESNDNPYLNAHVSGEKYKLDLIGSYQAKNLLGVLKSIEILSKTGFPIAKKDIKNGLKYTIQNTGLLGRWQILQKNPLIICETAHNEAGIKETLEQIKNTKHKNLHWIIGFVKDKDVSNILKLFPEKGAYYFCNASVERALPAKELKSLSGIFGLKGDYFNTPKKALVAAKKRAKKEDLIIVTGSIFMIAEII